MLIFCKFTNDKGDVSGKNYPWKTDDDLTIGETVESSEGKKLFVTKINITEKEADYPVEKIKSVFRIAETVAKTTETVIETPETVTKEPETVAETEPIEATAIEVETVIEPIVEFEELDLSLAIVVDELPVIRRQLFEISTEIQRRAKIVLAMECNSETVKVIKKMKASLTAVKNTIDEKRIQAKKEILESYENDFMPEYKKYITDIFDATTETLNKRIEVVENVIRQKRKDDTEAFFYEYLASKEIDWLVYEKMNLTIGISNKDNPTALRRTVTEFIDKVADELKLIDLDEHKAEIMVEYQKDLQLAKATLTVKARVKAVETQKALEAEREAKRLVNIEARRVQAEALEKARLEALKIQPALSAPVAQMPVSVAPPIKEKPIMAVSEPIVTTPEIEPEIEILERTFTVKTDREKMTKLRDFLEENKIEYEVL